ncbi:TPA: hypothetical protein DIU22_03690 [Candidatus Woesebacteria bacterium]|nr:hypothetical protein [Candidatus Woesebacteria bacterium]
MSIITTTKYTDDDLKKIKQVHQELEEAAYIGEDGHMACQAKTAKIALSKFKKLQYETIGAVIDDEILEIENVGKGYLFLTDKNNENHKYMSDEDVDWYVNWSGEEISDYWVYIYCV